MGETTSRQGVSPPDFCYAAVLALALCWGYEKVPRGKSTNSSEFSDEMCYKHEIRLEILNLN